MQTKPPILLLLTLLGLTATGHSAPPEFVRDIQPILERNCVRCHKEGKDKGDLRMDTHEKILEGGAEDEALVPGKPDESALITRTHLRPIDEGFMPDEGQALQPEELELLTAWVRNGAPWPKGVTLVERKPKTAPRVPLPKKVPASVAEAAAMMDDVLAKENAHTKVTTAPVIDDNAFLRRATIDLLGRIPTMQEVLVYESWDPKERRAKLVERLLTHDRFADRWTVFFADMLRIRSNVTGGNQLLAYVHNAVASGKPYDQLVRELISASGKATSNPAVGYILGDNTDPMELAAATSQVFLGVRIGCAMCHDHPFDDWEQKDFYDLAAFFGKTKQVSSRNNRGVYATEGHEMMVLWPPENKAEPENRKPVRPEFPFTLAKHEKTPSFVARFEKKRRRTEQSAVVEDKEASLDALLDSVEPAVGRKSDPVLEEAKRESRKLDVLNDLYRASELRNQLAELITDPRNRYFARAFVNRVWAELVGHGFVEPLDNFSDYNAERHPTTLDFLAQEFVASGYDLRSLIRIILLSDTYQRSHLAGDLAVTERERSEKHFAAAPVRRMLGEVLYDSVVVAGHLEKHKWPAGANLKEIVREVRVPTGESETVTVEAAADAAMMTEKAPMRGDGYDLESSLSLDFGNLLKKEQLGELDAMRRKSDEQLEAEKMAAMMREKTRTVMKYETKKVVDKVDDNPRFDSAMRMATPAPPAHFLRVFGQPARSGLGEFRDDSASLRQQLMMLNGRMTHEASRVGPLEPVAKLLSRSRPRAIEWAYQEILTRRPSKAELTEAQEILASYPDPADGMADLRWALLNSHEFRYLP